MKEPFLRKFKRYEIFVMSSIIAVVFVTAMVLVAWTLRDSVETPPYESLSRNDLNRVFATGYLRFREDDGTPYLKVEIHNGTLWWIRKIEFEFDGVKYSLTDPDAFRPLHFGALRCMLEKGPPQQAAREYDLELSGAFGFPPAEEEYRRKKLAEGTKSRSKKD